MRRVRTGSIVVGTYASVARLSYSNWFGLKLDCSLSNLSSPQPLKQNWNKGKYFNLSHSVCMSMYKCVCVRAYCKTVTRQLSNRAISGMGAQNLFIFDVPRRSLGPTGSTLSKTYKSHAAATTNWMWLSEASLASSGSVKPGSRSLALAPAATDILDVFSFAAAHMFKSFADTFNRHPTTDSVPDSGCCKLSVYVRHVACCTCAS